MEYEKEEGHQSKGAMDFLERLTSHTEDRGKEALAWSSNGRYKVNQREVSGPSTRFFRGDRSKKAGEKRYVNIKAKKKDKEEDGIEVPRPDVKSRDDTEAVKDAYVRQSDQEKLDRADEAKDGVAKPSKEQDEKGPSNSYSVRLGGLHDELGNEANWGGKTLVPIDPSSYLCKFIGHRKWLLGAETPSSAEIPNISYIIKNRAAAEKRRGRPKRAKSNMVKIELSYCMFEQRRS